MFITEEALGIRDYFFQKRRRFFGHIYTVFKSNGQTDVSILKSLMNFSFDKKYILKIQYIMKKRGKNDLVYMKNSNIRGCSEGRSKEKRCSYKEMSGEVEEIKVIIHASMELQFKRGKRAGRASLLSLQNFFEQFSSQVISLSCFQVDPVVPESDIPNSHTNAPNIPIKLKSFVELTMDIASASPRRYFFEVRIQQVFIQWLSFGKFLTQTITIVKMKCYYCFLDSTLLSSVVPLVLLLSSVLMKMILNCQRNL